MANIEIILGVVAAYFMIVLGMIMYTRYKAEKKLFASMSEFMLANKSLPTFVLVCTYVGSLFSTFSVLGIPAYVYAHGVGGYGFIILTYFLGVVICLTYYKYLRRFAAQNKIFSPLEAVSLSYKSKILGMICAVLFIIFLLPYISLQLVAVGKFLESMSGGSIGYIEGVGSMMIVVAIYLVFGGMRAVAYTDLIQLIAMVLGITGGALILLFHDDFSLSTAYAKKEHLTLPGPNEKYTPLYLISASIAIAGLFFQPHLTTRAMMAKDDKDIEAKAIGSSIAEMFLIIPVLFFGFGAISIFGTGLEPDQATGKLFDVIAQSGLFGLIISGLMLTAVLGAAMSTADSLLISIGQISTRDIARPFLRISRKKQVILSKVIMFLMLIISFGIGLHPPKFMADLVLYSASASGILAPTMLGFMWSKRSNLAAFASIFLGLVTLGAFTLGGLSIVDIHPGMISFFASGLVYVSVCLFFPNKILAKSGLNA